MHTEDAAGPGVTPEATGGEQVVAVDADDVDVDVVDRFEAHTGVGIRHRAFTCLLFDDAGHLLLAQRSPAKRLWDTYWDGTVASHPAPGQSQLDATRERLDDELGITPDQYGDLRETDRFGYKRYYGTDGVEWEVCTVLKATLSDPTLAPNDDEIGGLLWVNYDHLHAHPRYYRQLRLCPWFEIAMRRDFA